MKSSALSVMPEGASAGLPPASTPASSSELLASNPSRELGAPVTETPSALRCSSAAVFLDSGKAVLPLDTISDAEDSHDLAVSSPSVVLEAPILKGAAPILDQFPWVIQNRFSPLSELGNGVDEGFVEGEDQEGQWETSVVLTIAVECLKVVVEGVPKQPANSGSRGLRELKGLISNVNYDGVSSRSKSRVSLTAAGVVGSCK
ncbi:hypothetical protein CMV_014595 [Castanea mollissima]|uniref:Uncharacterized protein n=1 Tax=Castanea mollissima TaxID=60419 RepID=A0A8J4RCF3_9ROSI|nr:hypothetical protein CMV_014595 [Castanea mollissima]